MDEKMLGKLYRRTVICVDSYDNGIFQGRLYNPYLGKYSEFSSLLQMLKGIEQYLDMMNFPKPFTAARSFSQEAPRGMDSAEIADSDFVKGKLATFSINVMFRQNSSWQGALCWHEKDVEDSFRSVLELIWLLDSALSQKDSL